MDDVLGENWNRKINLDCKIKEKCEPRGQATRGKKEVGYTAVPPKQRNIVPLLSA